MTADDVYVLMQIILNKNQNGYFSPDDFKSVMRQAQASWQVNLLGEFQQYQPGRPIARVELGQNSVVRQRLAPSIYNYILNVDVNGRSPYPGDYLQADSMLSIYNFNRIRWVDQDRLYAYHNSVIDPIATNPIYLIEDVDFQFYPTDISQARLSYVRTAPDIVWGYTLDVNSQPVYSQANSVDPIWDDLSMLDIISRGLMIMGVHLQSQAVLQYAKEIKTGGQ